MLYNDLVDSMLAKYFHDIWFPSMHHFLDHDDLLSEKLTRNRDPIHLGGQGLARLVTSIKLIVFQREKFEREREKCERRESLNTRNRDQRPAPAPT